MLTPMERIHDPHLRVFMRTYLHERERIYDLLSKMTDQDLRIDVRTPFGRANACVVLMHMLCCGERTLDAIATSEYEEPRLDQTCERENIDDIISWLRDSEGKMLSAFESYKGASVTHYVTIGKQRITLVELLDMLLARESLLFGSLYSTLKG